MAALFSQALIPANAAVNSSTDPIYVEAISNLRADFLCGVDVSSYISERNSGVKFFDFDGKELDDDGFFNLLKSAGVNLIRLRVFNDPKTKDGKYYGGGNNDLQTAVTIGKLATKAGLKVLIDFHYSDFWADPRKQRAPKAWASMSADEKGKACYEFTKESLNTLFAEGVDVAMVQIGNETDYGIAGEQGWEGRGKVYNGGAKAVREVSKARNTPVKILVHYANPSSKDDYVAIGNNLKEQNVDYDVFATSYYPYWHGTLANLSEVLNTMAEKFDKEVMVVETSYINTYADGDGHPNTESEGKSLDTDKRDYPINPQGQAMLVRGVANAVASVGEKGIGISYWEPAWLPVGVVDWQNDKNNADAVLKSNKGKWEKYGSGWASEASGEFDPEGAKWWGGTAVDNEALFDFDGKPLPSLNIFKYIRTGNDAPIVVYKTTATKLNFELGKKVKAPTNVSVWLTDSTVKLKKAVWDEKDLAEATSGKSGEFTVHGTVNYEGKDYPVETVLTVRPANLMPNGGFETDEGWVIKQDNNAVGITNDGNNVRTGTKCLKFWDDKPIEYTVSQKFNVDKGTYDFGGFLEGGDAGSDSVFEVTFKVDGKEYKSNAQVQGWKQWQKLGSDNIEVAADGTEAEVIIHVKAPAKAWGAFDDFYLYKK